MSGRPPAPSFEGVADFGALVRTARDKRISNEAARFLPELEPSCLALRDALRDGSFRPGLYRNFEIREPKPRIIRAAGFADRVLHNALYAEIAGASSTRWGRRASRAS